MKAQSTVETACRHHWVLCQPREGAIEGRCRKCGVERRFPAALDEPYWGSDMTRPALDEGSGSTAAGGARPSTSALLTDFDA